MATKLRVPEGANERAAKLWTSIYKSYSEDLSDSQVELMHRLVEVIGVADDALAELKTDGLTFIDKSLQPKEHPCVKIAKEFIALEKAILTALYLDEYEDDEPI